MSTKAQVKKKYFKTNISISKIITHLKKQKNKEHLSILKLMDWYGYNYIDAKVLISPKKPVPVIDQDLITEILNDDFYMKVRSKI